MKKIELNPLSSNQRRLLQFGVVVLLALFLGVWFYFMRSNDSDLGLQNDTVYIENSTIYVFDDAYSLEDYPNRIALHYPYLLVIRPNQQVTHVYNLPEKRKETDIPEAILDYSQGTILKNDGRSTFLNERDLEVLCEKGLIRSEQEVLCLTKVNPNTVENKLISIDLNTNRQRDVYVSKDLITDFSVINDVVYMGEIDLYDQNNFLIIDGERVEAPSVVSLIYQMNGQAYFATLKNALSEENLSYTIFDSRIERIGDSKVILFQ